MSHGVTLAFAANASGAFAVAKRTIGVAEVLSIKITEDRLSSATTYCSRRKPPAAGSRTSTAPVADNFVTVYGLVADQR